MGFSNEWEETYKKKLHLSIWPWSDLVSYVMRYARPDNPDFTVLELGCGAGANIPFFQSLGVKYFGIEGSKTMIKFLKEKFPELKKNIICADFTKEFAFNQNFDLIVDRGSITHNISSMIEKTINNVYSHLNPERKFIGTDWFSTQHSEFERGEKIPGDPYSKKNYKDGYFANLGVVHYCDKEYILNLFKNFKIELLEHELRKREIPTENLVLAKWNIIATKHL